MHLDESRVTVAFHNFGAFTYEMREARSLSEVQIWNGVQNKRPFGCKLKLREKGKSTGKGVDTDGLEFQLTLKIKSED